MKSSVSKVAVSVVLAATGWWLYQTPAIAFFSLEPTESVLVSMSKKHSLRDMASPLGTLVSAPITIRKVEEGVSKQQVDIEKAQLELHRRYENKPQNEQLSLLSNEWQSESDALQILPASSLNISALSKEASNRSGVFEASNIEVRLEDVNLEAAGGNHKPRVNPAVLKQLQATVNQWSFSQEVPARYSLSLNGLFTDPEGDALTQQANINIAGLQVSGSNMLMIQGVPQSSVSTPLLRLAARDDYHGTSQAAWANVSLSLPAVELLTEESLHPLEGKTLYRLETTQLLAGVYYNYEVVYCEAWRFIDGIAYFAASDNRTQCPLDVQLQEIGYYDFDENNDLVVNSNAEGMRQQRWKLKKEYPSTLQPGVTNYFTTVYGNSGSETYTLQASKSAMEARLNIRTGEYVYQMRFFDYLYPQANGQYVLGQIGNYIYDRSVMNDPHVVMDSDLNMQSWLTDLSCAQLLPYWQSNTLAGQGETGDIISESDNPWGDNLDPIQCGVVRHPDWLKDYVYMGLHYSDYDIFVPGEIYSYVLKPKPELAHIVEEVKLNLHYHEPWPWPHKQQ
ncbi:hypothetical protein [Photobacterium sp. DNB22_13_2]